jgi:hypothetical protein
MCGRKWDLLGHFFLWLFKGKMVITAAKIPLIAALLVLGSTGFIVTGTIQGDEDDNRRVNLTIRSLESKTCVDALVAQTEALLELNMLAADGQRQLRQMRDRARENADEQDKVIDETALRAQSETSSNRIRDELTAARGQILDAADLRNCQDGNPDTGITLDVAQLRNTYDRILRDFGRKLNAALDDAQAAFDVLVANAQPEPPEQDQENSGEGSQSHSRD